MQRSCVKNKSPQWIGDATPHMLNLTGLSAQSKVNVRTRTRAVFFHDSTQIRGMNTRDTRAIEYIRELRLATSHLRANTIGRHAVDTWDDYFTGVKRFFIGVSWRKKIHDNRTCEITFASDARASLYSRACVFLCQERLIVKKFCKNRSLERDL